MYSMFRRQQHLFAGLWAEKNLEWTIKPSPVVWLKFASYRPLEYGLLSSIHDMMDDPAEEHGLDIGNKDTSVGNRL